MLSALMLTVFLSVTDPVGDVTHDGQLTPPTSAHYLNLGTFDVVSLEVSNQATFLAELTFDQLSNPWQLPYGFSLPIIELYVDNGLEPKRGELLSGSSMALSGDGWNYALRLTGEALTVYAPDDAGEIRDITAEVAASLSRDGNTLHIKTDIPLQSTFSLYGLVGSYDPFSSSGWRSLSTEASPWAFATADTQVPPVLDVIVGGTALQEEALKARTLPAMQTSAAPVQWLWLVMAGLGLSFISLVGRFRLQRKPHPLPEAVLASSVSPSVETTLVDVLGEEETVPLYLDNSPYEPIEPQSPQVPNRAARSSNKAKTVLKPDYKTLHNPMSWEAQAQGSVELDDTLGDPPEQPDEIAEVFFSTSMRTPTPLPEGEWKNSTAQEMKEHRSLSKGTTPAPVTKTAKTVSDEVTILNMQQKISAKNKVPHLRNTAPERSRLQDAKDTKLHKLACKPLPQPSSSAEALPPSKVAQANPVLAPQEPASIDTDALATDASVVDERVVLPEVAPAPVPLSAHEMPNVFEEDSPLELLQQAPSTSELTSDEREVILAQIFPPEDVAEPSLPVSQPAEDDPLQEGTLADVISQMFSEPSDAMKESG